MKTQIKVNDQMYEVENAHTCQECGHEFKWSEVNKRTAVDRGARVIALCPACEDEVFEKLTKKVFMLSDANEIWHELNHNQNSLGKAVKMIEKGKSGQKFIEWCESGTNRIKALVKANINDMTYHDNDLFSFTFNGHVTEFYIKRNVAFYAADLPTYKKAIRGVQAADHLREFNRLTKIADARYQAAKNAKHKLQDARSKRLYDVANEFYKKANAQHEAYRAALLGL